MPTKAKANGSLKPSPIDAWDRPKEALVPLPLRSGRVVEVKAPDLVSEVLNGQLPEQMLNWEVFQYLGDDAHALTPEQRVGRMYDAKLMRVARALVFPKLKIGPPGKRAEVTPDKSKGEIGPWQLSPQDIDDIFNYLIYSVLPAVDTAPFPDPEPGDGPGGAGGDVPSGGDVPPESQPAATPGNGA